LPGGIDIDSDSIDAYAYALHGRTTLVEMLDAITRLVQDARDLTTVESTPGLNRFLDIR
jgi:hypothetical protein